MLQLLVHASHDSDVVVIDQIDFLEVEVLREAPCFVREEEICDCLSLEWELGAEFGGVDGLICTEISKRLGYGITSFLSASRWFHR